MLFCLRCLFQFLSFFGDLRTGQLALRRADRGGIGPSREFLLIGERSLPFDDVAVAREALAKRRTNSGVV